MARFFQMLVFLVCTVASSGRPTGCSAGSTLCPSDVSTASILQTANQLSTRGRPSERQDWNSRGGSAWPHDGALPVTKKLHFLSMGRSGSCFLGWLFGQGRPYLFEPFNENGWGLWQEMHLNGTEGESQALRRLKCIYECEGCEGQVSTKENINNKGLVKNIAEMQEFCFGNYDRVVVKTVAINNASTFLKLSPEAMKGQKIVLLLRDPRGIRDGQNACHRQLGLALSIKQLVASLGKENIRTVFFEQWARAVPETVADIAAWAGMNLSTHVLEKAMTKPGDKPSEWLKEDRRSFAWMQGNKGWCKEFFDFVGYPAGTDIVVPDPLTEAARRTALPYDRLQDPTLMPITEHEQQLLAYLHAKHAGFSWAQQSHEDSDTMMLHVSLPDGMLGRQRETR